MKKFLSVLLTLLAIVAAMAGVWLIGRMINQNLNLDEPIAIRLLFVGIGLTLLLVVFLLTSRNPVWVLSRTKIFYMLIGVIIFAGFSYLFGNTVFLVPSISQVDLRPGIIIPMFFGYAFGPLVGLVTGTIGSLFGDALIGSGLSLHWNLANGLVGFITGLVWLLSDRKKAINILLLISTLIIGVSAVFYFLNPDTNNILSGSPISMLTGVTLLIGLVIVLSVRFLFGKNIQVSAVIAWSMLGNLLCIGFASMADIWVNQYSPVEALVGEFLPAAGPNLIFAAILMPILVSAFAAIQKRAQSKTINTKA